MKQNSIKMQSENVTICDYCGTQKEGLGFFIGASLAPAWTMIEGTGKMSCPDCWERARSEGREAVERHCQSIGRLAH